MEADVAVALVSGVGGCIASSVALVQAIRAAKIQAKTSLEVEALKLDFQLRTKAFDLATEESAYISGAIGVLWRDIQEFKELMNLILRQGPLLSGRSLSVLERLQNTINRKYRSKAGEIPGEIAVLWHEVKNRTFDIHARLESMCGPNGELEFPEDVSDWLKAERVSLSEVQTKLVERRQRVRDEVAQRIMQLLKAQSGPP